MHYRALRYVILRLLRHVTLKEIDCTALEVLDKFIREAKEFHSHRVRKYHANSDLFLRRHRRTIEQKMAMVLSCIYSGGIDRELQALMSGHISIKISHQEFMRVHMPDIWLRRPKRPWFAPTLVS